MKLFNWLFAKADGPSFEVAEFEPVELAAELTNVRKEIDQMRATHAGELAAKAEKIDELTNQLAAADADKATLTAQVAEKEAAILAERESANEKANAILAQAGHDPVAILPDSGVAAPTGNLLEQYNAMPSGPAKVAFLSKHKHALHNLAKKAG